MRISSLLLPTSLFFAVIGLHTSFAFQSSSISPSFLQQVAPSSRHHQLLFSPHQLRSPTSSLRYRELDEQDAAETNDAMLKVQTRAPPGFDMKENLQAKQQRESSAMNVPLIRAILLNQGLILSLATAVSAGLLFATDGFDGFSHLQEIFHWSGEGDAIDFSVTPLKLLIGTAAAIPIVVFGNLVEDSDNRALANINFSTITMVMTLFGRRTAPPDEFLPAKLQGRPYPTTATTDVLLQSLLLAVITGICEETVFRMEIPGLLNHYFGGSLPFLGSATLFALGHSQGSAGLRENSIVVGLQFINGLWFGLVYLLTGGDLVPCIVAHAAYDFLVFFKTWLDSNGQLEYAEDMFLEPLPRTIQKEVQDTLKRSGTTAGKLDPKVFNIVKKLFYTFDFDKNKTLSKSEVRKGFSYLALERAGVPPPQEQVDALFDRYTSDRAEMNRLTFAEFLQLYANSVSKAAARSSK